MVNIEFFFSQRNDVKKSLTNRHLYEGMKNGRLDEDIIICLIFIKKIPIR